MNDRHLCKAKRTDNGEWIEGNLYLTGKWLNVFNKNAPYIGNEELLREVDPSTICQCTGLKDKNGKLIWENDILMCHGDKDDLVKAVFEEFCVIDVETLEKVDKVVGWHYKVIKTDALSKCEPFCLPMPLTDEYISRCEVEVIGSAIDNPELLEVGE